MIKRTTLSAKTSLLDEVAAVAQECAHPNWDGHGALPVVAETVDIACSVVESLPLDVSSPSVGVEPDGHLTLEWHQEARRTLSVSISPDGNLHFAALLGPDRIAGTESFDGEMAESILELIRRVYSA